jgi:CMP-N-acetylneuraminic acid synthetase
MFQMVQTGAESIDSRCDGKQNGAIYAFKRYIMMDQGKEFIGLNHSIYLMPRSKSVDIDYKDDLENIKERE